MVLVAYLVVLVCGGIYGYTVLPKTETIAMVNPERPEGVCSYKELVLLPPRVKQSINFVGPEQFSWQDGVIPAISYSAHLEAFVSEATVCYVRAAPVFNKSYVTTDTFTWDHKCQTMTSIDGGGSITFTDVRYRLDIQPALVFSNFAISRDFECNGFVTGTRLEHLRRVGETSFTMKTSQRQKHSFYFPDFANAPARVTLYSEDDFSGSPNSNNGAFLSVLGNSVVSFDVAAVPSLYVQYISLEVAQNWNLTTDLSGGGIEGMQPHNPNPTTPKPHAYSSPGPSLARHVPQSHSPLDGEPCLQRYPARQRLGWRGECAGVDGQHLRPATHAL